MVKLPIIKKKNFPRSGDPVYEELYNYVISYIGSVPPQPKEVYESSQSYKDYDYTSFRNVLYRIEKALGVSRKIDSKLSTAKFDNEGKSILWSI